MRKAWTLIGLVALLGACKNEDDATGGEAGRDASAMDAGGSADAATPDAAVPDGATPDAMLDSGTDAAPDATFDGGTSAIGRFCGGIAGIQCPTGLECVDDPTDSCDPRMGGTDCSGVCVQACGSKTCGPTQECCSASCGICVQLGGGCSPAKQCAATQDCTSQQCGPAPGAPNIQCSDGVSVSGPGACMKFTDNTCGYTWTNCAP